MLQLLLAKVYLILSKPTNFLKYWILILKSNPKSIPKSNLLFSPKSHFRSKSLPWTFSFKSTFFHSNLSTKSPKPNFTNIKTQLLFFQLAQDPAFEFLANPKPNKFSNKSYPKPAIWDYTMREREREREIKFLGWEQESTVRQTERERDKK